MIQHTMRENMTAARDFMDNYMVHWEEYGHHYTDFRKSFNQAEARKHGGLYVVAPDTDFVSVVFYDGSAVYASDVHEPTTCTMDVAVEEMRRYLSDILADEDG